MKKFLSIILALTLVLSMSVTAFAEETSEGTQTVSVDVPTPCYDYTVHIPASCTIEYENTGLQSIGKLFVTSTDWSVFRSNRKAVSVHLASNSGVLTNENGKIISYWVGDTDSLGDILYDGSFSCQSDFEWEYFIQVSDWSGAEPGTTYSTTITYNISLMDTWWD